jgi:hypothetical protein
MKKRIKTISIAQIFLLILTMTASCQKGNTQTAQQTSLPTQDIQLQIDTIQGSSTSQWSQATEESIGSLTPTTVEIDYKNVTGQTPALYGSNGWWTDQDSKIWSQRYKTLGVNIIRVPAAQSLFEPVNDDADPYHINKNGFLFDKPIPWQEKTVTLGTWLKMLKKLDVTLMLYIPYLPAWNSTNGSEGLSSPYPPSSIPEYEEYVVALLQFVIQDVGFNPSKIILEPMNEPDLGCSQDANVDCFWKDWRGQDILDVLNASNQARNQVSSEIRIVGLTECCSTLITDTLVNDYEGLKLLDGFTYHKYISDRDYTKILEIGQHLLAYGKPVFLNEYGNTTVWSDGIEGALWSAELLPKIFSAGIQPLQFPISHFAGSHAGYENLGLFKDWRDNWEIKPAFWVYANFYTYFGNAEILQQSSSANSSIFSIRKVFDSKPVIGIWITTRDQSEPEPITLIIKNLPREDYQIFIFDNLAAEKSIFAQNLGYLRDTLAFTIHPENNNSYCILIVQNGTKNLPRIND